MNHLSRDELSLVRAFLRDRQGQVVPTPRAWITALLDEVEQRRRASNEDDEVEKKS
jgi:hypothetical protein